MGTWPWICTLGWHPGVCCSLYLLDGRLGLPRGLHQVFNDTGSPEPYSLRWTEKPPPHPAPGFRLEADEVTDPPSRPPRKAAPFCKAF